MSQVKWFTREKTKNIPKAIGRHLLTNCLYPPKGDRGIEIGCSVSPSAGGTPAKGASVTSSWMYKYSNSPSRRLCWGIPILEALVL